MTDTLNTEPIPTVREALATLPESRLFSGGWAYTADQMRAYGQECARAALDAAPADLSGLAHELWATAQLAPGQGIADGVERIEVLLCDHFRAAAPAPAEPQTVTAKPLEWEQDSSTEWTDLHHGLVIIEDALAHELPYCASWGEGDAEQFSTLELAQAWCQALVDRWIARHAKFTAPPAAAPVQPLSDERWIQVSERMPGPGVTVLFGYRNQYGHWRTLRGHHSPLHTVDASSWEENADETEDGAFEPEGWWEVPVESEEQNYVTDDVTYWKPLPAPPTPEASPLKEPKT